MKNIPLFGWFCIVIIVAIIGSVISDIANTTPQKEYERSYGRCIVEKNVSECNQIINFAK